ncbi:MAG: 23S rRNA (adenine(2030)-N(6))-methyltransferase RlmJ [Pseudomonadota bacterium]
MNYDHSYHAGNLADVFKHLALTLAAQAMGRKNKGFVYIDTHAGAGAYALDPGGEHEGGIGRVWPKRRELPSAAAYFDAVAGLNPAGALRHYPGSPLLAKTLLRPQDRLVLFETQPLVLQRLGQNLGASKGVQAFQKDGHQGLLAQIPPPEKRGLILIDPPFEARDEFERMIRTLAGAYKKWPQGVYLAWYPIKARGIIAAFHRKLRESGVPATAVELLNRPEDKPERLNGSGLIVVNPPWQFLDQLLPLLAQIAPLCADPKTGSRWSVRLEGWPGR